ncbi:MAG: hypothetical protein EOO05_17265 [Chitinophagaceae bacterium]|nr:MAG: hypothetical protein EOO05_17265 [Chitinophagaceae bacterium]
MAVETTAESRFEINLLFRNEKNAAEAFTQLLGFYEVFTEFDRLLLRNIFPTIVSEYSLEDIEFGSLKTSLAQVLKGMPDELVDNAELRNAINTLLVKSRYRLIKKLSDEKEITTRSQIETLTGEINEEITRIGEQFAVMVTQVNSYFILNAVDDLVKYLNNLREKELLEYKSQAGNTFIAKGITINKPKILGELGQRTIVNETTELLKIKKVDMLSSQPKWDFLQGKRPLKARMLDLEWLDAFHHREVVIKPEDALMVTLKTTHTYNPNFDDKKTDYEVVKVGSVISPEVETTVQLRIDQ